MRRGKLSPKQGAAEANRAESKLTALELRKRGYDYRTIATKLGVSVSHAYSLVSEALAELAQGAKEAAEQIRDLELARLDSMLAGALPAAESGDKDAIDSVIKIMTRRAKLLGLDAPAKQEVSGPDGGAIAIDDARAVLAASLARIASKPE